MPITQAMCTSFKAQILLAVHDFRVTGGDTFKLALYTSSANIDANTTAYTTSNEVVGTNYTAGGRTLTRLGVVTSNTSVSTGVGFTDFSDLTFPNVTVTARGALIYNTTPSANSNANTALTNPAVAVLDFGADKTATGGDFTINFPAATSTLAIIRIA
jgi:ribosomal protein S8E